MKADLTIDDVIEEHRVAMGADKVHLSLAPGATPAAVREELEKFRTRVDAYGSFSALEREQAKVARLRDVMRRVRKLTKTELLETPDNLSEKLTRIFMELDLVPDVDLEEDLAWMIAERERNGLSIPEKAQAFR